MKINKCFCEGFKKGFKPNEYISCYSIGEVIGEFLKIAITPFFLSTTLSLFTICANDKWFKILIASRDELIQITGLKLSFYILIILIGAGFITYSFGKLKKLVSWFISTISNIGFVISAVLTGVVSGVIFSEVFGVQNGISGYFKAMFYITMFLISAMFYIFSKGIFDNIQNEFNNVLGNKAPYVIRLFGVILATFGLFALFLEPWGEVFK